MSELSLLNETIAKIYKDLTGKGPKSLKTYFNEDLIIIKFELYDIKPIDRLEKIKKGEKILISFYQLIFEDIKPKIKSTIEGFSGIKVKSIFFDAERSAFSNEKIIVVLLEDSLDN